MKVRMKVDVSGSRNGKPWPGRGQVVDVPDAEGADLCQVGLAGPVAEPDADVETRESAKGAEETEPPVVPEVEQQGLTTRSAPAAAKKTPAKRTPAKPAEGK